MDLSKFVSLLGGNLYFARADKLGDRYEGVISSREFDLQRILASRCPPHISVEEFMKRHVPSGFRYGTHNPTINRIARMKETVERAQFGYVSCWHQSPHESAALWGLYLRSGEGVAVQSTLGRLHEVLQTTSDDIVIGKVLYKDFKKFAIGSTVPLRLLLNKRESFEHEKEYRAILQPSEMSHETSDERWQQQYGRSNCPIVHGTEEKLAELAEHHKNTAEGRPVPVDLKRLIERVAVAPGKRGDFLLNVVKSLVDAFKLDVPVSPSEMDDLI
jgi:hypothetical protein